MNLIGSLVIALGIAFITHWSASALASSKVDGKNIVYMNEKSKPRNKKIF